MQNLLNLLSPQNPITEKKEAQTITLKESGGSSIPFLGSGGSCNYNNFMDQFEKINPNLPLKVEIKSLGGAITTFLPIAQVLSKYPSKVTIEIDRYACSGGALVCLVCDEIIMHEHDFIGAINPYIWIPITSKQIEAASETLKTSPFLSLVCNYLQNMEGNYVDQVKQMLTSRKNYTESEIDEILDFIMYKYEHSIPIYYKDIIDVLKKKIIYISSKEEYESKNKAATAAAAAAATATATAAAAATATATAAGTNSNINMAELFKSMELPSGGGGGNTTANNTRVSNPILCPPSPLCPSDNNDIVLMKMSITIPFNVSNSDGSICEKFVDQVINVPENIVITGIDFEKEKNKLMKRIVDDLRNCKEFSIDEEIEFVETTIFVPIKIYNLDGSISEKLVEQVINTPKNATNRGRKNSIEWEKERGKKRGKSDDEYVLKNISVPIQVRNSEGSISTRLIEQVINVPKNVVFSPLNPSRNRKRSIRSSSNPSPVETREEN